MASENLTDPVEEQDPAFLRLEKQFGTKPSADDEEEEFEADYVAAEELEKASTLLKDIAVMLEFLSNRNITTNITKRERDLMEKQLKRIYETTDELDAAVDALEDDEEEDV